MPENPYDFMPPGGQFNPLVGQKITAAATIAPTKMIHHVTGTTQITTITPPSVDFNGPIYLIADSVFSWTGGGNIAVQNASAVLANRAYSFIYDRVTGKWYGLNELT